MTFIIKNVRHTLSSFTIEYPESTERNRAMGKNITAKCKHCGKMFSYSESAYKLASEKDTSRPRRCNECSSGHGVRIKSLPTPYFFFNKLIGESANVGNCDQELAFRGKRVQKEEILQADQSGMDISITDDEIINLYSKLESNQVVLMVSPTGTGKSTYVPKRLLQAPRIKSSKI